MLKKHEKLQKNTVLTLKKQLETKKTSHFYIIVDNGYSKTEEFVKDFIKELISADELISNRIDHDSLPDIIKIKPDGLWIKKEQIKNLQKEVINKSSEIEKKIYIIYEAEKLNISAANSMLKMLEEPEDNIVGMLITNNLDTIIPTIKSRGVIIQLNNDQVDEKDEKTYIMAENFILLCEAKTSKKRIYIEEIIDKELKSKEEIIKFLEYSSEIYKKAITNKIKKTTENNQLSSVETKNTLEQLIKKFKLVTESKNQIQNNLNIKLLFDKLIINLEEV